MRAARLGNAAWMVGDEETGCGVVRSGRFGHFSGMHASLVDGGAKQLGQGGAWAPFVVPGQGEDLVLQMAELEL